MATVFLTPEEIADNLKINKRTVLRWLNDGKLKGIKLEKNWRIRQEDFEEFLSERETTVQH